ncbi:hypothetical protein V3481_008677 [Fusarium oxysporum f. sp. vasinfectum]
MAFFKTKMPALDTSPVSSPVLYPSVTSDFEAANLKYAAKFTQSHLPSPPRRIKGLTFTQKGSGGSVHGQQIGR